MNEWQKAYEARHPDRRRARNAVNRAVKDGVLPRAASVGCVDCGAPAAEYDHYRGYAPEHRLDVQAVCVPCHKARSSKKVCARGHQQTPENLARPGRGQYCRLCHNAVNAERRRGERRMAVAS